MAVTMVVVPFNEWPSEREREVSKRWQIVQVLLEMSAKIYLKIKFSPILISKPAKFGQRQQQQTELHSNR